jgi:Uma2 family endonuclease
MQEPKSCTRPVTYAEFITYAAPHEGRLEFDEGMIVNMGIPSDGHQDLCGALLALLDPHLRDRGCKLRLASRLVTAPGDRGGAPKTERSPDGLVICNEKPAKLVCEILSLNRGDDLGTKRNEYEAMPEFEEYLLIDSITHWVRLYRRDPAGLFWSDVDYIAGSVQLESINYTLDIDTLYHYANIP